MTRRTGNNYSGPRWSFSRREPRALCDRRHDGVNDDRIGYFVKSIDGGEFFAEECKDCRWVEQLRERRP